MTTLTIEHNNAEYTIDVTWFYAGEDAVIDRLPEHCTPATDPEIEFEVLCWKLVNSGYDPDLIVEDDEEFIDLAIAAMIEYKIAEATDEY